MKDNEQKDDYYSVSKQPPMPMGAPAPPPPMPMDPSMGGMPMPPMGGGMPPGAPMPPQEEELQEGEYMDPVTGKVMRRGEEFSVDPDRELDDPKNIAKWFNKLIRKATGSETKTPFGSKIFERDFVDTSVEVQGEGLEATVEWALEMYANKQGKDNWFSGMQVKVKKVSITDRKGKTHEWNANQIDIGGFTFHAGYGAKYSHGLSPAVVVYPSRVRDLSTLDKITVKFNPVDDILGASR